MSDSSHKEHKERKGEGTRMDCLTQRWEVRRLKSLFSYCKDIAGRNHSQYQRLALTMAGVVRRSKIDSDGLQPEDFSCYQIVRENDLLFKLIDLQNISTSRVGVSYFSGLVSPAYIDLRRNSDKINVRFAEYYFKNLWLRRIFNGMGNSGVRNSISPKMLLNLFIPLPPLAEQEVIVAYLDAETERIDKAIAAEEKMIALLQERREIVINEAVAPHDGWEVRRIGWLMSIKPSISAPHEELLSVFLHKGVIRFVEENEKRTNVTSTDLSKYQLVEPGDFIMNNQQAWRGSVGVSRYRGIVSPAYFVMRLSDCLKPDFANYLLRSRRVVSIFERCSRGVGTIQRNLIWDMLKVYRIAFPPLPEQEAIVERLDRETGKIDRAIEVKRRQIELLRERRQIVIDEVVTGKVKVA